MHIIFVRFLIGLSTDFSNAIIATYGINMSHSKTALHPALSRYNNFKFRLYWDKVEEANFEWIPLMGEITFNNAFQICRYRHQTTCQLINGPCDFGLAFLSHYFYLSFVLYLQVVLYLARGSVVKVPSRPRDKFNFFFDKYNL